MPKPDLKEELATNINEIFKEATHEVSYRNQYISKRDDYIYGESLSTALDIPRS
jgi:hypothetical protein